MKPSQPFLASLLTLVNWLNHLSSRRYFICYSLWCYRWSEGWSEIRDYADGHLDWFQQHGYLSDGVPFDDTIVSTISRIDPEQFRLCFIKRMQAVDEITQGQLIAIDGKTLRGSYQRGNRQSTIHMVNAFACKNKLVLGQIKTSEKSNEITAIPELIKLLDIEGALASIDAMGCQVNIAESNSLKLYVLIGLCYAKSH